MSIEKSNWKMCEAMFEYFNMDRAELHLGRIPVTELVEEFGTPLYAYDAGIAERKFQQLEMTLPEFEIFYSLKANPNISLCSLFHSFGAKAEVASGGELYKALQAGFKPSNIIFVGPGKTREEIEYAIRKGIFALIAESPVELKVAEDLCEELDRELDIMLRMNRTSFPGKAPEEMIGGPSKFGFDEEKVVQQVRKLELPHLHIIGIHIYAASGLLNVEPVVENAKATIRLGKTYAEALNFELKCLDIGGGIGVPYSKKEKEFDIQKLNKKMNSLLSKHDLENVRLILESGRYLVAESGVFLTKVLNVKNSHGRRFLITDGGMNHEIRPVFMDLTHPTRIVNKLDHPREKKATVAGHLCTPIDVLAEGIKVPQVERGDIVGIFNAGAYGYSMSMLNFLSHPWPSEVIVQDGHSYLVRERGNFQDIKGQEIKKTF